MNVFNSFPHFIGRDFKNEKEKWGHFLCFVTTNHNQNVL